MYHGSIDDASISHIERVINEDEDDSLEDSLECVPENENQDKQLGRNEDQKLCGGDVQNQKPDDYHHDEQNNIDHAVELTDGTFGVTQ